MLLRSAARPGQSVLVLGNMGVFWAGVLDLIEPAGLGPAERAVLRDAMRRPRPRVREGELLSAKGWSRCAMDSSDGLISCFYEIAGSGRDIDLHVDLSPVKPDRMVTQVADANGIDVRKLQLSWGDWQLVCTAEQGRRRRHFRCHVRNRLPGVACRMGHPGAGEGVDARRNGYRHPELRGE